MSLQRRFKNKPAVTPIVDSKDDRWMSVKQAAAYTKVGRNALRKLADSRTIPHILRGKNDKVLFDRLDLDRYT
jgi:excisionase family DNA binding protein